MRTLPQTRDEWIGVVLFPFKFYVAVGFFFLKFCFWLKDKIQPRFYGYPEEATWSVSHGYMLCATVLVAGVLVQVIFCRDRAKAATTFAFAMVGCYFIRALWPWGTMSR
jgi:hypothetical protein